MTSGLCTMGRQKGMVIMVTSVMLLSLVSVVTIYTGRIKVYEYKILLNEQGYNEAFAAAEAGLMRNLGILSEDPSWDGTAYNETLSSNSTFTASATRQTVARTSNSMTLVTLSSAGTSADGLATTNITEQALIYSILANPPDAPLIVAGGLNVSGNFEVVANGNGGGTGVPLSIWTDGDVDMNNGSGTTCGLQEFNDGNCSSSPYSESGFQDLDIVDNDATFPSDLLEYFFNVPEAEWQSLKDDADLTLANCDSLGVNSTGLIWVDGDCSLNANTIIGQTSDPVILIVTDGDVTMNGGSQINGILFSFRKPGTLTDFELNMIGGARVNGAVASNHEVGHASGSYNAVYDSAVLSSIQTGNAFSRIAVVPGSWRDF